MILVIFFFVYLILNVFENYYRDLEKFALKDNLKEYKKFQKLWKAFQFIQWALVFGVVIYLLYSNEKLKNIIGLLLILGAWWNFLYDGALNLLKGRSFVYISNQTQSKIELFLYKLQKDYEMSPVVIRLLVVVIISAIGIVLWSN